ncbi:hypothetical protein B0H15DRAFT_1023325 [Mycena belliarum]|uniref:Uncharacterized protein n=1 Tax=Mycena belliarum TaxID=1033014 RepID=A0AAD6XKX2_9AGAR|nr:hypothetical protein B0H15DRAFT_1023325 [Mycena belliae]
MNGLRVNKTTLNFDPLNSLFGTNAKLTLYQQASKLHPLIVFLGVACVFAAVLFPFSKHRKRPHKQSDSAQALLTVIAPSSVAWPREYAGLVKHCASARSRTIAVSISSLIDNVCDGTVEVRNSAADLPELFSEKLVVYGWHVGLAMDMSWNWEVISTPLQTSMLKALLSIPDTAVVEHRERPALKRTHGASNPKANIRHACISFSVTSNLHLDLDYVPYYHFEASLLQLRAAVAPGTFSSLEFTTPVSDLAFLGAQFNICAIPFLPRRYVRPGTSARNRTATPLLASFHRILELLTVGPAALILENVSNMSKKYTVGLEAAAAHLEEDPAARTAFIQQWGVAGWREQRLMMAWEAALFSAGHLRRWVVVVRK